MMGLLENFLRESEKTDDAEREVIQCRISQDEYIEWNGAVIDGITAGFLSDLKEGRVQNHIREYVKVLRPE